MFNAPHTVVNVYQKHHKAKVKQADVFPFSIQTGKTTHSHNVLIWEKVGSLTLYAKKKPCSIFPYCNHLFTLSHFTPVLHRCESVTRIHNKMEFAHANPAHTGPSSLETMSSSFFPRQDKKIVFEVLKRKCFQASDSELSDSRLVLADWRGKRWQRGNSTWHSLTISFELRLAFLGEALWHSSIWNGKQWSELLITESITVAPQLKKDSYRPPSWNYHRSAINQVCAYL